MCYPDGTVIRWKYDELGQLKELIHKDQQGILDQYCYGYDAMGSKISVRKVRRGFTEDSGEYHFSYDKLKRLTNVERDGKMLCSYYYDSFGNRVGMNDNRDGSRHTYIYDVLNRLLEEEIRVKNFERNDVETVFRKTCNYDQRGNLTEEYQDGRLLHRYLYGAMNRIEKAWKENGKAVEYIYNGLGHRIGKKSHEENVNYLLDLTKPYQNLLCIENGDKKQKFFWDYSVAVMEDESEKLHFYLQDELGSPLRVLYGNGNGEIYGYDEFGRELSYEKNGATLEKKYSSQGNKQPFGYTGYQYDNISDAYFAQAREYMAGYGRFINRDKGKFVNVGDSESNNLYVYCRNSPFNYIDDSGNEIIVVSGGIDDNSKFDYMFIEPALKNVNDDIASGVPKEDITWMVVDAGYTETQMNNFNNTADKIGVNFVKVDNKSEFINYINNKDGGMTRAEDRITQMSFFSHGQSPIYAEEVKENQLSFAYHIENLTTNRENIDFLQSDIASLEANAFDRTLTVFYSCNAGTNDTNGKSFAQEWSNKTGGTSYGIANGRTLYSPINMTGTWGFHIPYIITIEPADGINSIEQTPIWLEKLERRSERAIMGYSEKGSLKYPCMVSWLGDLDVILKGRAFQRGWRKFLPQFSSAKE